MWIEAWQIRIEGLIERLDDARRWSAAWKRAAKDYRKVANNWGEFWNNKMIIDFTNQRDAARDVARRLLRERDEARDMNTHIPGLMQQIEPLIEIGEPFMTSGCPGRNGKVACNRPYGNERPSGPIRNFPFMPEPEDIEEVRNQVK